MDLQRVHDLQRHRNEPAINDGAATAPKPPPSKAPAGAQATSIGSPAAKDLDEALRFHPSDRNTLGVEMELQIIDPHTGDLAPGALRILKVCQEEKLPGITAELMQSMIEVKTGICQNVADARDQLLPLLRRLRNVATSLGYQLAMGGTHPFNRGITGSVFPEERYERIQDRL